MNSLRDDSEGIGEDGEECGGEGSDEGVTFAIVEVVKKTSTFII